MTLSTSAVAVCCCKRLAEIGGARLHLLEQPHVLDGDHRLIGEGLDEFNFARANGSGVERPSENTPITSLRGTAARQAAPG